MMLARVQNTMPPKLAIYFAENRSLNVTGTAQVINDDNRFDSNTERLCNKQICWRSIIYDLQDQRSTLLKSKKRTFL